MATDAEIVRLAAPWPGTAARLLEGLADLGPGTWPLEVICRASGSGTEPGHASQILAGLAMTGICVPASLDDSWLCEYAPAELKRLANVLDGAEHFRRMRLSPSAIDFAVTMPMSPSFLETELSAILGRPGGYLTTSGAFVRLARAAARRLVIMTPFIDAGGFRWIRRVFEAAPLTAGRSSFFVTPIDMPSNLAFSMRPGCRHFAFKFAITTFRTTPRPVGRCPLRPFTPSWSSLTIRSLMSVRRTFSVQVKACP
jgi:hypothetical protein